MEYVIYTIAAISIALSIGGLFTQHRGVMLASVVSIAFSVLAIHNAEWWPIIVGFTINWGLRLLGAEPR